MDYILFAPKISAVSLTLNTMIKNSLHQCIFQLFTANHHHICATLLLMLAVHPRCTAAQSEFHIPNSKITVSPTMAIIIACLIATFIIVGFLSVLITQYCIERRQRITLESYGVSAPNHRRYRRFCHLTSRGLDPSMIDTFPTLVYSEVKTDAISLECAVCLNEFEDTDTLRLLPVCCHVFHDDCIDAWLSTHVTCPVCRSNLAPESVDSGGIDDSIVDIRTGEAKSAVRMSRKERTEEEDLDLERFTLRLPEEARSRLVMDASGLSRTRSCVNFRRVQSSRKGYRSGSGGISKLGFMAGTPPRKVAIVGSREELIAPPPKVVLKSVRVPLHRLIWGTQSVKERVNDEERLFNRLRLNEAYKSSIV